jgi:hypothetical protein
LDRSLQSLGQEALDMVLRDAGARVADIGQVFYSGVTQGPLQGQSAVPGQILMSKLGLSTIVCHVASQSDFGSHRIFIGKVTQVGNRGGRPELLYCQGAFRSLQSESWHSPH